MTGPLQISDGLEMRLAMDVEICDRTHPKHLITDAIATRKAPEKFGDGD